MEMNSAIGLEALHHVQNLLCRLKDDAAMALYRKAGYEMEKEDCALVGLWNDRRQLLSKFIPRRQNRPNKQEESSEDPESESFVAEYWQ